MGPNSMKRRGCEKKHFWIESFPAVNRELTDGNKVQLQWNKNENKLHLSNTESQKDLGGKGHRANSKPRSRSSWPSPVEL